MAISKQHASALAGEFTNRVGDVVLRMFDDTQNKSLLKTPFYLYDSQGETESKIWCSGDGSWSLSKSESSYNQTREVATGSVSASDRGGVLEDFLRLEFITNIILMTYAGAYNEGVKPIFVFESFIALNMNRKIKLFKDYNILNPIQIKSYNRLASYRNKIAHRFSVDGNYVDSDQQHKEITYISDFAIVENALKRVHLLNQEKIINFLLVV